ncbi:hypothetical protein FHETE_4009 [Fusarium heterosporum]|uniref:Zn(2)-C6 fungal-type domain-containing protein n=1 Tax=Fusarium heterosporum TaxID=42747 RepID=A0A8H5TL20_FUSHE|nr:hypothetical protein FHETE_4009 [Fusarium heterosporum]
MVEPHNPLLLGQGHDVDMNGAYSTGSSVSLHPSETDDQQQQTEASGEKKRNKLGYHRTSVACGHCRRRKIRCITSPNDTQGRCINCIRLKKDCSFFPVDQAAIDDPRGKQASRPPPAPKGNLTTSSPATPISKPAEQSKKAKAPFIPSSKRPVPITVPRAAEIPGAKGFPPQSRTSLSSPGDTTHAESGHQNQTNWIVTAPDHSPTSSSELSTPWQAYASQSPMSAQFSPFTSVAHSPPGWPPGSSEPVSQGDMEIAWGQFAPPTRSMSYGGEPLSGNHASQYSLMAQGRQFERRPSALSEAYTASVGGIVPGFDGPNMNTAIPFTSGAMPPTNYTTWDQTQTYPGYTYMKNQDACGDGWSHIERGQDQRLQADSGHQVMNNAHMNAYQNQ